MAQNWLLPFGRRILLLNVDVRQLRDFSADFFFVFLFFAKFLATLDPNMHETKCRGARDLRVVKFSASYGPWRSQNDQKQKLQDFSTDFFFVFYFLQSFWPRWTPTCMKRNVGELEICASSSFQLRTALGAHNNDQKQKNARFFGRLFFRLDA